MDNNTGRTYREGLGHGAILMFFLIMAMIVVVLIVVQGSHSVRDDIFRGNEPKIENLGLNKAINILPYDPESSDIVSNGKVASAYVSKEIINGNIMDLGDEYVKVVLLAKDGETYELFIPRSKITVFMGPENNMEFSFKDKGQWNELDMQDNVDRLLKQLFVTIRMSDIDSKN